MEKLRPFFFIAALLTTLTAAKAQEKDLTLTLEADVVSQYIWRGMDMGNASLQPTFGLGYKGLSLSAWGNVGLVESYDPKEIDLTLNYSNGGFNVGITDYWTKDGQDLEGRFFMFQAHKTNHVFEANVGYDFGVASIQWFTNFAGADGINTKNERAYTSYVEASAPFNFVTCEWMASVGVVPWATSYYGTRGFAVTNLSLQATKEIRVTDTFSIPVFGQVVANPCSQKACLVFGFTLRP